MTYKNLIFVKVLAGAIIFTTNLYAEDKLYLVKFRHKVKEECVKASLINFSVVSKKTDGHIYQSSFQGFDVDNDAMIRVYGPFKGDTSRGNHETIFYYPSGNQNLYQVDEVSFSWNEDGAIYHCTLYVGLGYYRKLIAFSGDQYAFLGNDANYPIECTGNFKLYSKLINNPTFNLKFDGTQGRVIDVSNNPSCITYPGL